MAKVVIQNKFKSKVLWAAVVAQIVSILIIVGVIDTTLGAEVNAIVAIVLEMFVTFGILNSPRVANKF